MKALFFALSLLISTQAFAQVYGSPVGHGNPPPPGPVYGSPVGHGNPPPPPGPVYGSPVGVGYPPPPPPPYYPPALPPYYPPAPPPYYPPAPPVNYGFCSTFYAGEYVYDDDTGTDKTAQIASVQGCVATINYYGNWSGTYTIDLNSNTVRPQVTYNSRCSSFGVGEYIYDADTGIEKTAQITSIQGCSATINYYGNWSGTYTIDLNSPVVNPQ